MSSSFHVRAHSSALPGHEVHCLLSDPSAVGANYKNVSSLEWISLFTGQRFKRAFIAQKTSGLEQRSKKCSVTHVFFP